MRKIVTIQVEIETEFESIVFAEVGNLLNHIEDDTEFDITDVRVDNVEKTIALPALRSEAISTLRNRTTRSRYLSDYDGQ